MKENPNIRVFHREKPGCLSTRRLLKTSNLFYFIIVFFLFIPSYFFISHLSIYPSNFVTKDRASFFRVKTFSGDLSDQELSILPSSSFSHIIIIDAGSSGCRAHVYKYGKLGDINGPLYILPKHDTHKIKPGLSTFAKNPSGVGAFLTPLIDFLKTQIEKEDWEVTPIFLKATAGLRLLPPYESQAILTSVQSFLLDKNSSPFYFRPNWASIISGNEEGGYAWISYNYLKKIIDPHKRIMKSSTSTENPYSNAIQIASDAYTVIEMGGASIQVSQLIPSLEEYEKLPANYRFSFEVEGDFYHLYTHSYLGYGGDQAYEHFIKMILLNQEDKELDLEKNIPDQIITNNNYITYNFQSNGELIENNQYNNSILLHKNITFKSKEDLILHYSLNDDNNFINEEVFHINPCIPHFFSNHNISTSLINRAHNCLNKVGTLLTSFSKDFFATPAKNLEKKHLRSVQNISSCKSPPPYSFGCVHQPSYVLKTPNILAYEKFFYISKALGVPSVNDLEEKELKIEGNISHSKKKQSHVITPSLLLKSSFDFCSQSWQSIDQNFPKDKQEKKVNKKNCFLSAYAYHFLVNGLKISTEQNITIEKEVSGSEIEWALGAAYFEVLNFIKRSNLRSG